MLMIRYILFLSFLLSILCGETQTESISLEPERICFEWAKQNVSHAPEDFDSVFDFLKEAKNIINESEISNSDVACIIILAGMNPYLAITGTGLRREAYLAAPLQISVIDKRLKREELHAVLDVLKKYSADQGVRFFAFSLKSLILTIEDGIAEDEEDGVSWNGIAIGGAADVRRRMEAINSKRLEEKKQKVDFAYAMASAEDKIAPYWKRPFWEETGPFWLKRLPVGLAEIDEAVWKDPVKFWSAAEEAIKKDTLSGIEIAQMIVRAANLSEGESLGHNEENAIRLVTLLQIGVTEKRFSSDLLHLVIDLLKDYTGNPVLHRFASKIENLVESGSEGKRARTHPNSKTNEA